ncbi:hypothetical protein [Paenibacillus methanolicus]|uniref:Uncharacterized protein n=1 Tax=Paenibacillus methanolicus TaxID=582686 RepID=A0A5S5C3U5_9BACL|nr:hypothetical protein [Paenibacillus methanolicus]TYP73977.1 hypothetical protein BCM02_106257 [Paenibacillus methanolicus]
MLSLSSPRFARLIASPLPVLLFLLTLAVLAFMNLVDAPLTVVRFQSLTGGNTLLDLMPLYSPAEASALLDRYGEEGRAYHVRILLGIDLALPAFYGLSSSLLMFKLLKAPAGEAHRLKLLALLPAAAALADYAENGILLTILGLYPRLSNSMLLAASSLTLFKTTLLTVSLLLVAALSLIRLYRRLVPRAPKKPEPSRIERSSKG